MNDAHIEHLLRSLQPTPPSADLELRVQRDLALAELFRDAAPVAAAPAKKTHVWREHLSWAAIGAAAAVAVMSVLPVGTKATSGPTTIATANPSVLPVNSSREWVDVEEGNISYASAGAPQRQLKVRSLERHQWIDPRDGAEYTVETPVTDSVVMPVKFQ